MTTLQYLVAENACGPLRNIDTSECGSPTIAMSPNGRASNQPIAFLALSSCSTSAESPIAWQKVLLATVFRTFLAGINRRGKPLKQALNSATLPSSAYRSL